MHDKQFQNSTFKHPSKIHCFRKQNLTSLFHDESPASRNGHKLLILNIKLHTKTELDKNNENTNQSITNKTVPLIKKNNISLYKSISCFGIRGKNKTQNQELVIMFYSTLIQFHILLSRTDNTNKSEPQRKALNITN